MFLASQVGGTPESGSADSPFLLLLIWSAYVAGRHGGTRWIPWNAAVGCAFVAAVVSSPGAEFGDFVFPTIVFFAPLAAGAAIKALAEQRERARAWAAESDRMRDAEVRHAVLEERVVIARELHDVVAHRMSALSLQAQLARREREAGNPTDVETLRRIESTARQSMADLRRLLGLLRPADAAAELSTPPSLDDIADLVEAADASGRRLNITEHGQRPVIAPALSMAAFRILQEAVTNARRHGDFGPTAVDLEWKTSHLLLTVTNPVSDHAQPPVAGHGLIGMSERAQLFGGSCSTSVRGGKWRVEVSLPLPAPPANAVS